MEEYKSANDYTINVSIDIILIPLVSAPVKDFLKCHQTKF